MPAEDLLCSILSCFTDSLFVSGCLLSYMGNLMNQCVDKNDSYACYNDNLHKDRLLSRHEPMCENPYYEKRVSTDCINADLAFLVLTPYLISSYFFPVVKRLSIHSNFIKNAYWVINRPNCVNLRRHRGLEV